MRVGIVTVHDSSNMGSYLQALGIQEIIKLHGDTPYFIKTRSRFSTLCLFLGYNNAKPVRSIKSFARFCLGSLKHIQRTKKSYDKYRTYKKDWRCYDTVVSVKKANKMNLDCILIGSDELWNIQKPAFQNPYLYGIGLKAKKKLGYAISVGGATKEELLPFENLREGIRELDGILCRDDHTIKMLQEFGIESSAKIADPTIQSDIRKYMKAATEVKLPDEPYIGVYSYNIDNTTKEWIKRFAKENGLKIAAISLPIDWADEFINCSPLEFGVALGKASYIYTNTFHGTIFSSLYHTRFVSLAELPKIKDVLDLLGLADHALPENADYETFSKMLKRDYDFSTMEENIRCWRDKSSDLYEQSVKQGD